MKSNRQPGCHRHHPRVRTEMNRGDARPQEFEGTRLSASFWGTEVTLAVTRYQRDRLSRGD